LLTLTHSSRNRKGVPVTEKYEYTFVRLEGRRKADYQQVIQEHAGQGWRLVQVFAPGAGGPWASADYVEVILERKSGIVE
jgi:hypothetical protein